MHLTAFTDFWTFYVDFLCKVVLFLVFVLLVCCLSICMCVCMSVHKKFSSSSEIWHVGWGMRYDPIQGKVKVTECRNFSIFFNTQNLSPVGAGKWLLHRKLQDNIWISSGQIFYIWPSFCDLWLKLTGHALRNKMKPQWRSQPLLYGWFFCYLTWGRLSWLPVSFWCMLCTVVWLPYTRCILTDLIDRR